MTNEGDGPGQDAAARRRRRRQGSYGSGGADTIVSIYFYYRDMAAVKTAGNHPQRYHAR